MVVSTVPLCWLLTTLCLLSQCIVHALRFELPDNEKACFFHDFEVNAKYTFEYTVIKGGKNDVDVSLVSPNGKQLYAKKKQKHGIVAFDTSIGTFAFCFSNEFSTFTHKVVYFDVQPDTNDPQAVRLGNLDPRVNTQLEASIERIYAGSGLVQQYQGKYRLNEARGRNMADELVELVHWWSLGQATIILLTGLCQVVVLKAFFAEKKYMNTLQTTPDTVTLRAI